MINKHISIVKLVGYFIIMPIVVWNLTIGKSIHLWRECERNELELSALKSEKRVENADRLELSANGYLLDSLSEDKNIEIVKYSRYITASVDDYSLVANVLVISGDYFQLLEAIYQLENTWTINSLAFQTEVDYKTKQKSLNATLITQEILKMN